MAVKMRLRREGKKKQPFYRVVVADARSPRDGRFIEDLGFYQPTREPSAVSIDRERALHWLRNGVKPSNAVVNLLRIEGIWEEFRPGDPGKARSQRARAAAAARADAAASPTDGGTTAPTGDPVAEAPPEVVEQAVAEDTQPDPKPTEESGALDAGEAAEATDASGAQVQEQGADAVAEDESS